MAQASIDNFSHAAFWAALGQIVFINILLSGDNAIVIAMACRDLPRQQRRWGMVIGAGAAVLLRIVFSGIIAQLMLLPYLKMAGGVALLYIAVKLLVPKRSDKEQVETVASLWRAVGIVVVADVVMSFDNIVAIAAAANGSLLSLAIGLALSIPLILAGATLTMAMLDRFPLLIWAGAALLGWLAGEVIATDPVVASLLTTTFGGRLATNIVLAAAGAGAVLVVGLGGLWRRLRDSRAGKERAGGRVGRA
ncbi:MAG TPA: TerC family protein [Xanthobacteraceae bacterium]